MAQSGAGPATPVPAPVSPLGAGSLPPLSAPGLLQGPALGRPSPAAKVLCGVNEASAKAGGGAGAGPRLWEPGLAASGRPAFVCTPGELACVPVATGTAPARVWGTSTLSWGLGSAHPKEPPPGLPGNPPGGEWSKVTRVGALPMGLRGPPSTAPPLRANLPWTHPAGPVNWLGRQVPLTALAGGPGSSCTGVTRGSFPGLAAGRSPLER